MNGLKTDTIINRDALYALRELPEESVHCCVTSPPYYALRDYGLDAQIGREDTPEQYIDRLTEVFRELRRVLRSDGTLWLNIADTYCGTGNKGYHADPKNPKGRNGQQIARNNRVSGCKQKDLIGIPWLLAFALRADGWYLRSDIVYCKNHFRQIGASISFQTYALWQWYGVCNLFLKNSALYFGAEFFAFNIYTTLALYAFNINRV